MKTFNLTEKETKLTQAGEMSYDYYHDEIGYQNCDGDPACFCFTLEEAKAEGFTKHQVAGLISSLEAKGVVEIEHRDPVVEGPDLFWLSEDFINFIARQNIEKEAK